MHREINICTDTLHVMSRG